MKKTRLTAMVPGLQKAICCCSVFVSILNYRQFASIQDYIETFNTTITACLFLVVDDQQGK